MHHPSIFGNDWINNNLDMAIKGHLLQKLKPAPKSLTFSSIRNLWLRFNIQAHRVHQYHRIHHPSKFDKDRNNNNFLRHGHQRAPASESLTCSKNINLFQHSKLMAKIHEHLCLWSASVSQDASFIQIKCISIIKCTIHARLVKLGPIVIQKWLSKGTCYKNFNLIQKS